MNAHGAPPSLAQAANDRLTVAQEEKLAHCQTIENNLRHMLRFIQESSGEVDASWLTIGRTHLQIGMMCIRRAITRQDFF
jgi:hypothetical protein